MHGFCDKAKSRAVKRVTTGIAGRCALS